MAQKEVGIGPFPPPNPFPVGARVRPADLNLLGTVVEVSSTEPKTYTVTFTDARYEQLVWIGGPSK